MVEYRVSKVVVGSMRLDMLGVVLGRVEGVGSSFYILVFLGFSLRV